MMIDPRRDGEYRVILQTKRNFLPLAAESASREPLECLQALSGFVQIFADALHLFNWCDEAVATEFVKQQEASAAGLSNLREQRKNITKFGSWSRVAARDGAITIYNFGMALSLCEQSLRKSPVLAEFTEASLLNMANDSFKLCFPKYKGLRHSLAHAGEASSRVHVADRQRITKGYKSKMIQVSAGTSLSVKDCLNGREYSLSREGEMIAYFMDQVSFTSLNTIFSMACSALHFVDAK